ncbi:hypothetical protein INT45_001995 [Circinella minor]|uniref:Uncharacterized protein n=1 Tax=Circinella minor TaxID=1195481 RepID=A0A8H7R5L4_9FUNG|nr:hypothetical protein INT45_001995 [Circinella minor]
MVDNAVQHARARDNKERLPSSVRPDTNININIHNSVLQNNIQNSTTMHYLIDTLETDETLFGKEEGVQTVENLYTIEEDDNDDSDIN